VTYSTLGQTYAGPRYTLYALHESMQFSLRSPSTRAPQSAAATELRAPPFGAVLRAGQAGGKEEGEKPESRSFALGPNVLGRDCGGRPLADWKL